MNKEKENGFEARERLGDVYWNDPDWEKVKELRREGKQLEANGLVFSIRYRYGID